MTESLATHPLLVQARDAATDDGTAVDRLARVMDLIEPIVLPFSGPGPEGMHRDDMSPESALAVCYDLWASGTWPDANAEADLGEVVTHLDRALD